MASQTKCFNDHNSNTTDQPLVLRDYYAILDDTLAKFDTLSCTIGGELLKMMDLVRCLFAAQRQFLQQALKLKKPSNDQDILQMIKSQSTEIEAICGK